MSNGCVPKAKKQEIVVQQVDGELLIYDVGTNTANCLNDSAAIIWKNCDGAKDVAKIRAEFEEATGSSVSDEFVRFGIGELQRFKLVDINETSAEGASKLSRREVIRRISLTTAVALPFVASLVAPTAAHANSACIPGGLCVCTTTGMAGDICTPSVPCADPNCLCAWENNGNTMGTCVP